MALLTPRISDVYANLPSGLRALLGEFHPEEVSCVGMSSCLPVEWKKLGEVCEMRKGIQFNKSAMQKNGTYPVINGGINPSGYVEVFNQDENTITISQGGASAGYVNWMPCKFWAGAHCYVLNPSEKVSNRYLYHFVKSRQSYLQKSQYGAGIPALSRDDVLQLEIPIPPLPVQEKIVSVLDRFEALTSDLTAGLPAEIAARRKQYEHYRDRLLNFPKKAT